MGGRPVWSVLVGLFFALTAFAVFSLLGTFIVRLDDTSTRIYDDSAFPNGDKTRIVIQRLDAAPFEQEDYDALLALSHVDASVQYPMVTGGVMIVSTLLCLFGPKKPSRRELLSVLIGFAGMLALFLIPD